MNQTHIHLFITHLPLFGSMFGGLVLLHGFFTKSIQTNIAAYYILILSAIGAGIAYLTGEGAEETIENIQGIIKSNIEAHEEFALFAIISLISLGVLSLLALFFAWNKSPLIRPLNIVILILSGISFILVSRTAYLGGQIRHTELNPTTNLTPVQMDVKRDGDID
jgi:uncharacterized membrane protein